MGDRDDGILLDEAQGQEQEQDESLMDLLDWRMIQKTLS